MTHHEFWDEKKREQELVMNEPMEIASELPPPQAQEPEELYHPYRMDIYAEHLDGLAIFEHAFTNSTGLNVVLKYLLGWNQNQRTDFMKRLIADGSNEYRSSPEAEKPYSIRVTSNEPL